MSLILVVQASRLEMLAIFYVSLIVESLLFLETSSLALRLSTNGLRSTHIIKDNVLKLMDYK